MNSNGKQRRMEMKMITSKGPPDQESYANLHADGWVIKHMVPWTTKEKGEPCVAIYLERAGLFIGGKP